MNTIFIIQSLSSSGGVKQSTGGGERFAELRCNKCLVGQLKVGQAPRLTGERLRRRSLKRSETPAATFFDVEFL